MKTFLIIFFVATFLYSQDVKLGFQMTFTGNNVLFVNGAESKSEVAGDKKGINFVYAPLPYFVTGIDFNGEYGIDLKAGWTGLQTAEPFTVGLFPRIRVYDKLYLMGVINKHFEGNEDRMTQGYYAFDGFSYGAGLSYKITRVFSLEYIIHYTSPKENYYYKPFSVGKFDGPSRITLTKIDYIMQLGFNFKWDLL